MHFGILALTVILVGILSRLIPHAPNMAAITSLMIFSGVYLPKRFLWTPFLALLISDYFIGFYGTDMLWVYGSYLLIGLLGLWLKFHKKVTNIIFTAFTSSALFFLITNFGVWAPPNKWYQHTLEGLIQSYTMALPFFRNSLIADLGYTIVLFGGYEIVQRLTKKYFSEKIFRFIF